MWIWRSVKSRQLEDAQNSIALPWESLNMAAVLRELQRQMPPAPGALLNCSPAQLPACSQPYICRQKQWQNPRKHNFGQANRFGRGIFYENSEIPSKLTRMLRRNQSPKKLWDKLSLSAPSFVGSQITGIFKGGKIRTVKHWKRLPREGGFPDPGDTQGQARGMLSNLI